MILSIARFATKRIGTLSPHMYIRLELSVLLNPFLKMFHVKHCRLSENLSVRYCRSPYSLSGYSLAFVTTPCVRLCFAAPTPARGMPLVPTPLRRGFFVNLKGTRATLEHSPRSIAGGVWVTHFPPSVMLVSLYSLFPPSSMFHVKQRLACRCRSRQPCDGFALDSASAFPLPPVIPR